MRTAILTLLVLGLATAGWAGPVEVKSTVPVMPIEPDQGLIWYQAPHYYVWTLNASTAFGSEVADDIPEEVCPVVLYGFIFYAGEWAGYWMNPDGFSINLYYQCCPPGPSAEISYYFTWDNPDMSRQVWYYSPGWFESWEVVQTFDEHGCPPCPCTSIGVQLDNPWGTDPPYAGVAMTDYYMVYGCGQAYWCFEYYGVPRWVTIQGYFGVAADMAYGIIGTHDPTATEPTTWGMVKSLYE